MWKKTKQRVWTLPTSVFLLFSFSIKCKAFVTFDTLQILAMVGEKKSDIIAVFVLPMHIFIILGICFLIIRKFRFRFEPVHVFLVNYFETIIFTRNSMPSSDCWCTRKFLLWVHCSIVYNPVLLNWCDQHASGQMSGHILGHTLWRQGHNKKGY